MPQKRHSTLLTTLLAVLAAGCGDHPATQDEPEGGAGRFEPLFPPVVGELMTISSPALADLDGDGARDIVFGTGVDRVQPRGDVWVFSNEPEISGHVVAVSGATNEVLWKVPNPRDAFTTPRFLEIDGDGVPDVLMGGREGAFGAFSGKDGASLWRVAPTDVAETPVPYNFTTPALIGDRDGDGVDDLVVIYGGDATRKPPDPRDPSYLAVVSGATGKLMAVFPSPDGAEMYSSPVVYERPDGQAWFLFGTGGETRPGSEFRAPVASLVDGSFPRRVERLLEPGEKGVMSSATLVELTGDDDPDIVLTTFDGRLSVLDGATRETIWEIQEEGEETYHQAAVVRLPPDGRPGFFVSRGIGAFPRYVGAVHRLYDGRDGTVLFNRTDTFYPAGAPLAVDVDGDGFDEPFFFSVRYPSAQGARVYVLHVGSGELETHDLTSNFWSTPVIADPRGSGKLEFIGLGWTVAQDPGGAAPDWRSLDWEMFRLDLGVPTPSFLGWAGYMGTEGDGRYRLPGAR